MRERLCRAVVLCAFAGCQADVFSASWGCNPTAIAPAAPQSIPAAGTMTVTLPASSLSILTVPTA